MSNAKCLIQCPDTKELIEDLGAKATEHPKRMHSLRGESRRLELTVIESDGATWAYGVQLCPDIPMYYNPENRHLQVCIEDDGGIIPIVIMPATDDVSQDVASQDIFEVKLFPNYLNTLRQRQRAVA